MTSPSLHDKIYTVTLKIMYSLKTHSSLLKLRENTRSSIEKQAKEYIWVKIQQNIRVSRIWTSQLLSVVVKEEETDLSGYEGVDLTFLPRSSHSIMCLNSLSNSAVQLCRCILIINTGLFDTIFSVPFGHFDVLDTENAAVSKPNATPKKPCCFAQRYVLVIRF
jgi:hypothetical protein